MDDNDKINRILYDLANIGDRWDFQHEEVFFKNHINESKNITKQDHFEESFQAWLLELSRLAKDVEGNLD